MLCFGSVSKCLERFFIGKVSEKISVEKGRQVPAAVGCGAMPVWICVKT
jgi:hypothetical protein